MVSDLWFLVINQWLILAIVFSSGMLKVTDMIISGFFISIATMLITIAYMQSFAYGIFDLDTFPEWARISGGNATGF